MRYFWPPIRNRQLTAKGVEPKRRDISTNSEIKRADDRRRINEFELLRKYLDTSKTQQKRDSQTSDMVQNNHKGRRNCLCRHQCFVHIGGPMGIQARKVWHVALLARGNFKIRTGGLRPPKIDSSGERQRLPLPSLPSHGCDVRLPSGNPSECLACRLKNNLASFCFFLGNRFGPPIPCRQ